MRAAGRDFLLAPTLLCLWFFPQASSFVVAAQDLPLDPPQSPESLLRQAARAVESVQSLYFSMEVAGNGPLLVGHEDDPGLERNSAGAVVWMKMNRWWDARGFNRCQIHQLRFSTTGEAA